MKKLLSLLSVLTISGTAVPTTIAASPYQKQEKLNININYSQTNNLKNLNRSKRNDVEIETVNWEKISDDIFISKYGFLKQRNFIKNLDKKYNNYNRHLYNVNNFFYLFSVKDIDNVKRDRRINLCIDGFNMNINILKKRKIFPILNNIISMMLITEDNKVYIGKNGSPQMVCLSFKKDENLRELIEFRNKNIISVFYFDKKIYLISSDKKIYEYDLDSKKNKLLFNISSFFSHYKINNNNFSLITNDNSEVYDYFPNSLLTNDDLDLILYYFNELKNKINIEINFNDKQKIREKYERFFKLRSLKYFLENKLNIVIKISKNNYLNNYILGLKEEINKLYEKNNKLYMSELEKINKSNVIYIEKYLLDGLYLNYQKQNPNSYVKNINFNMNDLKYSNIELIKEEELSMQKIKENICVGETEFENWLPTEQKFKTQSCKYTNQKINSIQVIKGINKRIDNTLESGESSIDTTSTTNTNSKTKSLNVGTEVSAGWGLFSVSVSTSVGNEESNTSQIENSESKTKNISKIISNSSSFDLSKLKEEQEIVTNELEYPSQEITVGGNQSIKVIFNLNKIIKKYKVTFKQNISGKIKAKIKNENDQIIEQEFSIKDILLSLKENNILPKEILINNNLVSFIGELIVSKNSSKLKLKTEEIDKI